MHAVCGIETLDEWPRLKVGHLVSEHKVVFEMNNRPGWNAASRDLLFKQVFRWPSLIEVYY